jgi:hypothetical protein
MDKELLKIGQEIRDIITEKQKELELTFVEDTHTYYIKNKKGVITTGYPSVSTVIGQFYTPFPDLQKSFEMSQGDLLDQDELLTEWRATADYANNQGSRVHYLLETKLLEQYGSYKEVRVPIFDCDEQQITDGDTMIESGLGFIDLMHERGAVLLDTEMVLGSTELGYTGQPDKVWLIYDKQGVLGFIITDWKTNKPKNFEVHHYTGDMLKGTKYENIKFLGSIIVHLTVDGQMTEYRIPKKVINTVLTMDPLPRIDHVMETKKLAEYQELERIRKLDILIHGFHDD